jgi:hypothetical protein
MPDAGAGSRAGEEGDRPGFPDTLADTGPGLALGTTTAALLVGTAALTVAIRRRRR